MKINPAFDPYLDDEQLSSWLFSTSSEEGETLVNKNLQLSIAHSGRGMEANSTNLFVPIEVGARFTKAVNYGSNPPFMALFGIDKEENLDGIENKTEEEELKTIRTSNHLRRKLVINYSSPKLECMEVQHLQDGSGRVTMLLMTNDEEGYIHVEAHLLLGVPDLSPTHSNSVNESVLAPAALSSGSGRLHIDKMIQKSIIVRGFETCMFCEKRCAPCTCSNALLNRWKKVRPNTKVLGSLTNWFSLFKARGDFIDIEVQAYIQASDKPFLTRKTRMARTVEKISSNQTEVLSFLVAAKLTVSLVTQENSQTIQDIVSWNGEYVEDDERSEAQKTIVKSGPRCVLNLIPVSNTAIIGPEGEDNLCQNSFENKTNYYYHHGIDRHHEIGGDDNMAVTVARQRESLSCPKKKCRSDFQSLNESNPQENVQYMSMFSWPHLNNNPSQNNNFSVIPQAVKFTDLDTSPLRIQQYDQQENHIWHPVTQDEQKKGNSIRYISIPAKPDAFSFNYQADRQQQQRQQQQQQYQTQQRLLQPRPPEQQQQKSWYPVMALENGESSKVLANQTLIYDINYVNPSVSQMFLKQIPQITSQTPQGTQQQQQHQKIVLQPMQQVLPQAVSEPILGYSSQVMAQVKVASWPPIVTDNDFRREQGRANFGCDSIMESRMRDNPAKFLETVINPQSDDNIKEYDNPTSKRRKIRTTLTQEIQDIKFSKEPKRDVQDEIHLSPWDSQNLDECITNQNSISIAKMSTKCKYKCPTCDMTFEGPNEYKVHRDEVHAGLKPFCCELCPSSFITKCNLNKHERAVHGKEKRFKCDICQVSFFQKSDIVRHMKSKH